MRTEMLIWVSLLAAIAATPKLLRENKIKSIISKRQQGEPKTSEGAVALLHEFPYHVALKCRLHDAYYNGALITDSWVITTATVAKELQMDVIVLLGAHIPNKVEVTQQKIYVDEKIVHEYHADGSFANNVALFHLENPATLNRFVNTIMLAPFNSPNFDGARLKMIGLGFTSDTDKTDSNHQRYVEFIGISNAVCKTMRQDVHVGTLCVETTGGLGGCDWSNGALLVDVNSGLLVGLMAAHGSCSKPVFPSLFTRVSKYTGWVIENMQQQQQQQQ